MQQFRFYTFVPSVLVIMDMISLAWEILVLLILSFPLALHSENSTDVLLILSFPLALHSENSTGATKFDRCYLTGHSFGCRFVYSS